MLQIAWPLLWVEVRQEGCAGPWGRQSLCWGLWGRPEQPVVQPEVGSWLRKGGRARVVMGREDQLGMSGTQEPRSGSGPGAQGSI